MGSNKKDIQYKFIKDLDGESWVDIIGWEGLYQISNYFRVKGLYRVVPHKTKRIKTIYSQIIRQYVNSEGYLCVRLSKNGVYKQVLHHRLVAIHFIQNHENKPQVNHINGIKTDNRILNLEWCTLKENQIHSWGVLGRVSPIKGKFDNQHPLSKKVKCVTLGILFNSSAQASRTLGISQGSISNVCKNKRIHAEGLYFKFL